DLPPAVGQVIARALSKRPEDRQQSAGELVEALELAASGKAVAATTEENHAAAGRDTNRIVVPTAPFDTRPTANNEYDEATVVRPNSGGRTPTGGHEIFDDVMVEPPPTARFNPWVVIIPAAALLIALLGIFYVVSRNSPAAPASNDNSAPLSADPNALPAQTAQPPTGAGESNITAASPGEATPSPTGGAAAGAPGATGADAALPPVNANVAETPSVVEETKDNRNTNQKSPPADDADPTSKPSPSTGASPQRSATPQATPKPTVHDPSDDPPPPSPRRTATPQATPPNPVTAQEAPAGDPPPPSA
ncbi:MAG: hypothetical protein ACJ741_03265, partial [Pyrinomonadaceae bacterium]